MYTCCLLCSGILDTDVTSGEKVNNTTISKQYSLYFYVSINKNTGTASITDKGK